MNEDKRAELKQRLISRQKFDKLWEKVNFFSSQIFVGTSVIASFGTAIIAASNVAKPLVLGILAAIPGTVIIIDKSFRFADRWRWHCIVGTKFAALEQKLTIEDGNVEEISREARDYLFDMEKKYPVYSLGAGHETTDKQ